MKIINLTLMVINYLKYILIKLIYSINHENKSGIDLDNGMLTVSLTTYSKRISDVHLTIESILRQKIKAKEIILWLDKDEFDKNNIPRELLNQTSRGLKIRYTSNMRSYKKLIPILLDDSNKNVLTIDDDVIYPPGMIRTLQEKMINTFSKEIIAFRCHEILLDEKKQVKDYRCWNFSLKNEVSSMNIFPTGVGGVLYPANTLHKDVINYELANELCPNADDVWFKAMSIKSKVSSRNIKYRMVDKFLFTNIPTSQDIALYNTNQNTDGNDKCIKNVFKFYNIRLD